MNGPKSNKEKVLHTRVPESLEAQIKALADALRVPVSSLVRNILEDSVAVIDSATSELDQTLKNVSKNVRTLSERARLDQKELRRGWSEFQTILSESFKARDAASDERASAAELFLDVVGWQPLTLNLKTTCARCSIVLAPGDDAHLGVREQPGPRVLICDACLPRKDGRHG